MCGLRYICCGEVKGGGGGGTRLNDCSPSTVDVHNALYCDPGVNSIAPNIKSPLYPPLHRHSRVKFNVDSACDYVLAALRVPCRGSGEEIQVICTL